MKKINLSKKQILLIVWMTVLSAIFVYFLISSIQSLTTLCHEISLWQSRSSELTGLTQFQIKELINSYRIGIIKLCISFILISTLYVSSIILLIQKFKLTIKDRINPPTL